MPFGAKVEEKTIRKAIIRCTACPLSSQEGVLPVPWRGPLYGAVAAIIGEAPGQTENDRGKPFVGRAGEELSSALEEAGWDESQLLIFNTVQCWPRKFKPLPGQIHACRPHRRAILNASDVDYVILLGNFALRLYKPSGTIGREHGKPFKQGRWYLPTYHPAWVLRGDKEDRAIFVRDLSLFLRFIYENSAVGLNALGKRG